AWSALTNNERVGGLLMRDADHWEMRPRNSRRTVLALLSALASPPRVQNGLNEPKSPQVEVNRFGSFLRSVRRVARPGSSIFLISDFDGAEQDDAREELFQLARHVEITAIHCSDPLESQLPPPGRYSVTDGQSRSDLDTGMYGLAERFAELYATRMQGYEQQFQRLGIPLLRASTSQAPLTLLRAVYTQTSAATTKRHGS
ncbi:MAG: DUF58 domain-containing protein, partial [Congregibacter sp.]|nr:DUF58 domain-containing protein [Congregibacter sp.]